MDFKKFIYTLPLFLMLWYSPNNAQAQATYNITHKEALEVLLAAQKEATKQKALVNIAVVDAGANLKAFLRMDESYIGSIDIAIKKAKTSRYFNTTAKDLGELTQPGGMLYNIEVSNNGLISFPGGVPIKNAEGKIIGAIGISGGTIEQDHDIGLKAAQSILK